MPVVLVFFLCCSFLLFLYIRACLATLAGVPVLGLKSGALQHADLSHRWLGVEGWQVLLGALEAGRKTILSLDLSYATDAAQSSSNFRTGNTSSSSSGGSQPPALPSRSGGAVSPGLGLVPLLGRSSCALARLALDGGAVPGDAFAYALAPSLPRNRSLTDLSLVLHERKPLFSMCLFRLFLHSFLLLSKEK